MTDYKKDFIKCLQSVNYSIGTYDVFTDFLSVASLSLANVPFKNQDFENEYLQIIKKYKQPEKLAELLGIVKNALATKHQDFLGDIFMELGFGSQCNGQFFTPYHISHFMAQITMQKDVIKKNLEEKGYITVCDPCVGAGAMIIAASEVLLSMGYNPHTQMLFSATDIDRKCFDMTYIQTTLYGLAGQVTWGDSLTMTENRTVRTFMAKLLQIWKIRLKDYRLFELGKHQKNEVIKIPEQKNYSHKNR